LLLSFDPTIGGAGAGHGPPELKQLILSGADSNTTPSGVVRTAGAYRFLSLYKPLVMAAKRKGGPLCRNRVWISGKSIVVRRTATMTDTIYSGAANVNYSLYLTTYHGGRRLDFTNVIDDTLSSQQTLYQQNGAWSAQALGPPNEYSLSGSQNSHSDYYDFYYGGRSHNADSVVDFQFVGGARPPTGAPIQLLVYDSARTTLLRTLAPITSSVMNVWATTYSPRGDALYAAVTSNPYIGMEYWKLPLNGAAPTRLWTLPNGLASSLAVSEDGTELVADVEQQNSPHYMCWTEYRSTASGVRLDSVGRIDHDDCSVYHQGAASASRAHLLTLKERSSVGRSTLQSLFH